MIDYSDGDSFWLLSLFTAGPIAFFALIIAIVLWFAAYSNEVECRQRACPPV